MNAVATIVWNTLYPDRRPWDQLTADTQEEWSRMVCVVEELVGRELAEANADRLRLREALDYLRSTCLNGFLDSEDYAMTQAEQALTTPPPPVVAKADADALAEAFEDTLTGNYWVEGRKALETYRAKYP